MTNNYYYLLEIGIMMKHFVIERFTEIAFYDRYSKKIIITALFIKAQNQNKLVNEGSWK